MSERFSEEDLAPDSTERRAARGWVIDRLAAATGVTAAGLVLGGMLAVAAAPAVFSLTPRPFSGYAMGQAFTRFGQVALGAACVALLVEVVRTVIHRRGVQRPWDRVRRLVAIGVAGCAAAMAFNLTPEITRLHEAGAVRGEGEQGMRLEATHRRAELVGKLESGLALALIFLHVMTLRGRVEDDEPAQAPLPPGPRV
jgi:hypothetical protein